jgi:hypothetical protein
MIIALNGYAGAGKDTVGSTLVNNYGFTRVSFADILKEEVSKEFKVPLAHFHERDLKEKPVAVLMSDYKDAALYLGDDIASSNYFFTPRLLCIYYAAIERTKDPDVWVKKAASRVKGNVVITDLRYKNEAAWVKSLGGVTVRIDRSKTKPAMLHESETQLDDYEFDIRVKNDSTLAELDNRVEKLLTSIKESRE